MSESRVRLLRWGIGVALVASGAHLGWEATHGGVRAHHLLARSDLPSVSNWWGLLVLPVLGGLSAVSVEGRLESNRTTLTTSIAALIGSTLVGLTMSALFAAGFEQVVPRVFLGVLVTGAFLPIYRPEYLFGFVLGMTFALGSVIPLAGALFAAGVSLASHYLIKVARRLSSRMPKKVSS